MFINYFKSPSRASPINLAAARIILGVYFFWRAVSIEAGALTEWPFVINDRFLYLYPPEGFEGILYVEQWALVAFSIMFLVGYRTKLSAFMSALLLSHFAGLIMLYNGSGRAQSMAIASLLVLLLGLYNDQDYLSIDAVRNTKDMSLEELNITLKSPLNDDFRADALRWSLLSLGIIYFGSGFTKIATSSLLGWTAPGNLARWIALHFEYYQQEFVAGALLLESELALTLSTWGTIAAELGLLVAVVVGVTVTPPLLVLLGMHTIVLFTMGIFFFDSFFFIALFIQFDKLSSRLSTSRDADLVYDEHCYFCARSLYLFKHLNVTETVTFYSQHTAPEEYQERNNVQFDEEMYIFADGNAYGGYYAFRELLRQFWLTTPVAWFMSLPPITIVGERVYKYIADNRSRYFVCSFDPEKETSSETD